MRYNSLYDVRKAWLSAVGGTQPDVIDSVHGLTIRIVQELGGNVEGKSESIFKLDKEILRVLGGDDTADYQTIYEIDKAILQKLGGYVGDNTLSKFDINISIVDTYEGGQEIEVIIPAAIDEETMSATFSAEYFDAETMTVIISVL